MIYTGVVVVSKLLNNSKTKVRTIHYYSKFAHNLTNVTKV